MKSGGENRKANDNCLLFVGLKQKAMYAVLLEVGKNYEENKERF